MSLKAALDTSSATAAFSVVGDDGLVHFELAGVPLGRETGGLTQAITNGLNDAEITLTDIRYWTIGMGPGSFSGIRIGAALVKGICAGTGASYRGVPSSFAMAQAVISPSVNTVAALYDGRRGEVLVSIYQQDGGRLIATSDPYPTPISALAEVGVDRYAVMSSDRALPELKKVPTDDLVVLDDFPARRLIDAPAPFGKTVQDMEASTEPVYVRAAVFTPPSLRK